MHSFRYPGESEQYRQARNGLLEAEIALRRREEHVAAMRRELPLGGEVASDYVFTEWDEVSSVAQEVSLSALFGAKDTLLLYSFMVVGPQQGLPFVGPCPNCTSIIDALDGELPHVTQRIAFAVAAKASIEQFREHGRSRGWRHARLLSTMSTDYSRDYGAETDGGSQWPMANVFVKRDGRIHHFWGSELFFVGGEDGNGSRHVDFIWPLWAVLDRTPSGRGDEHPRLNYDSGG